MSAEPKPDPCPTRGTTPRGRTSPATCYCPGKCAICGWTRHMAVHESDAAEPTGALGMHRFVERKEVGNGSV